MSNDSSAKPCPHGHKYDFPTIVSRTPTEVLESWFHYCDEHEDIYKKDIIRYELELRKVPVKKDHRIGIILLLFSMLISWLTGWYIITPILAIFYGVYICISGIFN